MERGDTGLGRDAYGPPRHERDRRGYDLGPYPSDDGYPAEEGDAAGSGRRVEAEDDDYRPPLRRPGEMPPRPPRVRQPGRPQPGRFPPGAPPNGSAGHAGMPGGAMPGGLPGDGWPGPVQVVLGQHLVLVVQPDHGRPGPRELNGKRQSDITQTDNADCDHGDLKLIKPEQVAC